MGGRAKDYVKAVRKQTSYWLNFPPAMPLKLGDIVIRNGGIWVPIGNVADQGAAFETEVDDSHGGAPWVSQSESGVAVESSVDANPGVFKYLQPGEVGVKVSFDSGNKYVLSLVGTRFHRVRSIDAFWDAVRAEYSVWTWDLRRRVVTSVAVADSGTFLGSGDSAASYELAADAGVNVQGVDLGKISADFKLSSTSSSSETFVGLRNVTPLFRLHKVTLLGNFDAAAVGEDSVNPATEHTELVEDDTDPDSDD